MRRATTNHAVALAVFLGVCLLTSGAGAQQLLSPRLGGYSQAQPIEASNPVINPFLLMTDAGQTGILNYQTLVQPMLQQRQVMMQQSSSITQLQQQARGAQMSPSKRPGQNVRDTGHETRYLNYSHYFNSVSP
jgi:hypothetical protein